MVEPASSAAVTADAWVRRARPSAGWPSAQQQEMQQEAAEVVGGMAGG